MTTVDAVSSLTTPTATAKTTTQETEDRFLKLLVTQMQNQDPLNPMDNAEITSQMAQLSTVTELGKLNDAASALSASFLAGQSLQAASLIGRDVVLEGNGIQLSGGSALGMLGLPQSADSVSVEIKDASGAVVKTLDLGAQPGGMVSFSWDGLNDQGQVAADGAYSMGIKASSGGQEIEAMPFAVGRVSSVTLGGEQGVTVNLAGMGSALIGDIQQIM